eukprot:13768652-Alexandrium_andersonii.AAC.1
MVLLGRKQRLPSSVVLCCGLAASRSHGPNPALVWRHLLAIVLTEPGTGGQGLMSRSLQHEPVVDGQGCAVLSLRNILRRGG